MLGEQRGTIHRTATRICVVAGATLAALVGLVASAPPVRAAKGDTALLLSLANQERAARGLAPVAEDARASSVVEAHCRSMREQNRLFHRDDVAAGITGWSVLGENVGVGANARKVHEAFMSSPVHRANVLNPKVTLVGLCTERAGDVSWVTEVFFDRAGVAASPRTAHSPSTPRRPTDVATTARFGHEQKQAVANATVTPARRRLPRTTPPVAPASRSISQLVRMNALADGDANATTVGGESDCERRAPGPVAVVQNAAMALVMLRRRRVV